MLQIETVLIVHSRTFRTVCGEEVTFVPKLGWAKEESASQAGRIILKATHLKIGVMDAQQQG